MQPREFLMIPGPTPCPDAVLEALRRDPLGHRTKEFSKVLDEVAQGLKKLAECEGDVFIITGSGTAGMEMAIANSISPGDKVLVLICGVFGERWAKIAEAYGAQVERMKVDRGEAISVDVLRQRLLEDKERTIKAVCLTHNETSTGVIQDLEHLALAVREHGALCVVDAVSSFAAVPISFTKWGIDLMVAGCQKALMLPPGLSYLFVGERAWDAYAKSKTPKFYFDMGRYRDCMTTDTTPFTPNVSLVMAQKVALDMINKEGKNLVYARHERLKSALRAGILGMGLKLFVNDSIASPTITSIVPPSAVSVDNLRRNLKERFQIRIADGQDDLKSKIFRIGHMGYVFDRDILMTLAALEACFTDLGFRCPSGIAVGSALPVINTPAKSPA